LIAWPRDFRAAGAVNDALTWERAAKRSKIIDRDRCPEHDGSLAVSKWW